MKMKKLMALLLALVMMLAMVACGKGDDKTDDRPLSEQIVGKWAGTVAVSGEKMELPSFTGSLELKVEYTFNADGTGGAKLDIDAYKASVEANRQALCDALVQLMITTAGSREAAESNVKAQTNMTLEQFANSSVDTLKTSMPADLEEDGEWTLEGDKLTVGELVATVSIDGDKMTWTGSELEEELGVSSVVFNRV